MKNANSDFLSISEACKICFSKNIKVTREIANKQEFIIVVDYDGRKKVGTERYHITRDKEKLDDKIRELYVTIAKQIQSGRN